MAAETEKADVILCPETLYVRPRDSGYSDPRIEYGASESTEPYTRYLHAGEVTTVAVYELVGFLSIHGGQMSRLYVPTVGT